MMIIKYIVIGLLVMVLNYVYRYWESKGFEDREEPSFIALALTIFIWPACLFFLLVDVVMLLFKRN